MLINPDLCFAVALPSYRGSYARRHQRIVGPLSSQSASQLPDPMSACAICAKSVGFSEERKACKKVYHRDCFKCGRWQIANLAGSSLSHGAGGANADGCRKTLTLDGYTAHADEPYCTPCYNKLFAPAGEPLAGG